MHPSFWSFHFHFEDVQVHSGAKPYLNKVINALVEALIVALLNVFTENKHKFLRLLDVNGYCQLTLEVSSEFSNLGD